MKSKKILEIIGCSSLLCSVALGGALCNYTGTVDFVCADDFLNYDDFNDVVNNNSYIEYRFISNFDGSLLDNDFEGDYVVGFSFDVVYYSVKLYTSTINRYNSNYYCDVDVDIYADGQSYFSYLGDDSRICQFDIGGLNIPICSFSLQNVNDINCVINCVFRFKDNAYNELFFYTYYNGSTISMNGVQRYMSLTDDSDGPLNGDIDSIYNFNFDVNKYINNYLTVFGNGKNEVLNNLDDYNLYTEQNYLNYGISKFNDGVAYASDNDLSFYTFIRTIFSAPSEMFRDSFNWVLPLGDGHEINMLPLMTFVLTIGIAFAVFGIIKKFL